MENSIKEIVNRLQEANAAYREGKPIMADREYDELEHQLKRLDPENDWFNRGVNDETPKTRKVKLPFQMMSLDKVKSGKELKSWLSKYPDESSFVITPKFDGMTMGVRHSGSCEKRKAYSRGDGIIGQDCTSHFQELGWIGCPTKATEGKFVRGEVLMTWDNFEKFKVLVPEAKNPRNSTTGLINGDFDPAKVEMYKCLSYFPYQICEDEGLVDKLDQLWNINVPSSHDIPEQSFINYITPYLSAVKEYLMSLDDVQLENFLQEHFATFQKAFPCDGLVIDVNEAQYRHGINANGNPSYTIAYKHPSFSESCETIITRVEMNVNRDGIVTPVLHIVPVFISGAEISKVNGINMKYLDDWGLYPGTRVKVVRSGDVIPKIVAVEGLSIPFREDFESQAGYDAAYGFQVNNRKKSCNIIKPHYLSFCPCCGTMLSTSENDNVNMVCKNVYCSEKIVQQTIKAFEILGLQEFGEETFRQLHKEKKIESWTDVFYLTSADLEGLSGWGEKSISKFLEEVKKVKCVPFARLAHATGWFGGLGEKTIQLIVDHISEQGLDIRGWSVNDLCKIPGIAEKSAFQFCEGYSRYSKDVHFGQMPVKVEYWATPKREIKDDKLLGMKVCMTGFRDENLKGQIEERGGKVTDNVSKDTTCLLCKDKSSNSGKVKKAQQLGIEILTRQEFIEKHLND